jgi:hypothetical protein
MTHGFEFEILNLLIYFSFNKKINLIKFCISLTFKSLNN